MSRNLIYFFLELILGDAEIDAEMDNLNAQIAAAVKEREKKDGQQAEDARNLARQQKSVERYLTKRQLLLARKDECNKNIRDLGVLPEEAFIETTASSEKVRDCFLSFLFPTSIADRLFWSSS